jgi:hypothetical protein
MICTPYSLKTSRMFWWSRVYQEEAVAGADVDDLVAGHRLHGLRGDGRGPGDLLDAPGDEPGALFGRVGRGPPHAEQRLAVEDDRGGDPRDLRLGSRPARRGGRRGRLGDGQGRGKTEEGQGPTPEHE